MDKPEALRLADALETGDIHENAWQAAAELRRLLAENGALRGERTKLDGWWQDALQAAGRWERQFYKTKAQRDALLEALKLARSIIGHPDDAHSQMIDAAIAKATGEQP